MGLNASGVWGSVIPQYIKLGTCSVLTLWNIYNYFFSSSLSKGQRGNVKGQKGGVGVSKGGVSEHNNHKRNTITVDKNKVVI